jgi:2,4-didehydro-3-deoxy-L-rhamnonate hydrolase
MACDATRTQIFGVAHIMSYLSRFMALQAGDVIATGTPPGVGLGHKPPLFLKAGDRVELDSRMLGEQWQEVVAFDDERMGWRWREGHLPLF